MARMTIRDIARLAGVSVTTVSRALNNAPEINSQTRERVLQVCREQGYRSNLLARSLVSSRTRVLGVILPELSGPFHASIVLHLERYAQEQDYQIMLCCGRVGGSETAALFDFLVSHRVDGILLVSASSAAPDLLRRHARGTPSVLLGDVSPTATLQRINAVSTDNYVGGAMAAGYLSRLGHRRVLYLGPRRDSVTHVLRHQGFLTIARERGMEVETVFNPGAVSSAPNGYRLARQVFARPFPQTAVFAPSDAMALGVLQAADELGLDIPGRISLLGYDDIEYASLPKIRLSTLAQPTGALAESAVRLLLELIDSGGPGIRTKQAPGFSAGGSLILLREDSSAGCGPRRCNGPRSGSDCRWSCRWSPPVRSAGPCRRGRPRRPSGCCCDRTGSHSRYRG